MIYIYIYILFDYICTYIHARRIKRATGLLLSSLVPLVPLDAFYWLCLANLHAPHSLSFASSEPLAVALLPRANPLPSGQKIEKRNIMCRLCLIHKGL